MRRLPWGRVYEVELALAGERTSSVKTTRVPVTMIDPYLGVGDAWALIDEADDRWDGRVGEWVTFSTMDGTDDRR
jgi:hypothetical protein